MQIGKCAPFYKTYVKFLDIKGYWVCGLLALDPWATF